MTFSTLLPHQRETLGKVTTPLIVTDAPRTGKTRYRKLKIEQIAYHRNGVSGIGFHAVIFTCPEGRMLASVFPKPGVVSVISLDALPEHGVTFGANSWRGDQYEPGLRAAIAENEHAA